MSFRSIDASVPRSGACETLDRRLAYLFFGLCRRSRRYGKDERQQLITSIVSRRRVGTQHELLEALARAGCRVTQATVSRDIRELGLDKTHDVLGRPRYVAPQTGRSTDPRDALAGVLSQFGRSVDGRPEHRRRPVRARVGASRGARPRPPRAPADRGDDRRRRHLRRDRAQHPRRGVAGRELRNSGSKRSEALFYVHHSTGRVIFRRAGVRIRDSEIRAKNLRRNMLILLFSDVSTFGVETPITP